MSVTELTDNIKIQLSIFDRVGIGTADRFADLESENHPDKYMPDLKSVIVFAEGKSNTNVESLGSFKNYIATISAQANVITLLKTQGYDSMVIDNKHHDISLVRIGIEAGLGEISPVDSLVIKGLGLTATLGAIITNAPLTADKKVNEVCINCNKCLRVCPIREIANAKGDLNKCACGACVYQCPVKDESETKL